MSDKPRPTPDEIMRELARVLKPIAKEMHRDLKRRARALRRDQRMTPAEEAELRAQREREDIALEKFNKSRAGVEAAAQFEKLIVTLRERRAEREQVAARRRENPADWKTRKASVDNAGT